MSQLRFATQRAAAKTLRHHGVLAARRTGILLASDLGVLLVSRVLFRLLRAGSGGLEQLVPSGLLNGSQPLFALAIGLAAVGAYSHGDRWRSWARVWQGVALGVGLVLWDDLFMGSPGVTLVRWMLISIPLAVFIASSRTLVSVAVDRRRRDPEFRERVLLLTGEDDAAFVTQSRLFDKHGPFSVRRTLEVREEGHPAFADDLLSALQASHAGTIIVAGMVSSDVWARTVEVADAAGCRLLSMAGHGGPLVTSVRQTSYRGIPVAEVISPHLRYHQLLVKRTFDLLAAGLLVVVLSPLLLAIALAVRLSSPGPVVFSQERVGLAGRTFRILKFRSMREDAEELLDALRNESLYGDARLFKMPRDPRVTRVGAFLRKWSLDELPQLFNVLKGDMSMVGPRPPIPREVVLYEAHHYARFDVKPGITGPWQVAGRNEIRDFEEVVLLERDYIRNWNLGKDLQILIETVPVVLLRRGAY